eukprot:291036-Alexandrium_andersonii.AAC.1
MALFHWGMRGDLQCKGGHWVDVVTSKRFRVSYADRLHPARARIGQWKAHCTWKSCGLTVLCSHD